MTSLTIVSVLVLQLCLVGAVRKKVSVEATPVAEGEREIQAESAVEIDAHDLADAKKDLCATLKRKHGRAIVKSQCIAALYADLDEGLSNKPKSRSMRCKWLNGACIGRKEFYVAKHCTLTTYGYDAGGKCRGSDNGGALDLKANVKDLCCKNAGAKRPVPTAQPTEPPTEPPTQPPTEPPTEPPTDPPAVSRCPENVFDDLDDGVCMQEGTYDIICEGACATCCFEPIKACPAGAMSDRKNNLCRSPDTGKPFCHGECGSCCSL